MNQLGFDFVSIKEHALFRELAPHVTEKFFSFHQDNPRVFDLFKGYANDLRTRGFMHYAARTILERIRWDISLETTDELFKINNNFTPCYARLLMITDRRFEDFFELRRSPGTVSTYYDTEGAA